MEVCTCGHPRERHVFQVGVCTLRPKNLIGEGTHYCICNRFEKDLLESSKQTAEHLKEGK